MSIESGEKKEQEHPMVTEIRKEAKRISFGELSVVIVVKNGTPQHYDIIPKPSYNVDKPF